VSRPPPPSHPLPSPTLFRSRPYVTLKWASSLDGRAAAADGTSQWITGEAARSHVHEQRAAADAIIVGTGTVLADDPSLTARDARSEEHTSELQSRENLVCRL